MGKLRGLHSHTKGHDRAKGLVEGGDWKVGGRGRGERNETTLSNA